MTHREHILVVDDDPMSVKLIRALLTGEGYSVYSAKSAEEALALLGTFDPCLILVDIQLPGVDGLELTRQLRSKPSMHKTCIVALTAYALRGDEQKAESAGCDGYITKPIDVRTLPATVRQFLKKSGSPDGHPSNGTLQATVDGPLSDAHGATFESGPPEDPAEQSMVADLAAAGQRRQ